MKFLRKNLPWILGLIWLSIRVLGSTYFFEKNTDSGRTLGVMMNLFFIILIIFSELSYIYKERRKGVMDRFMGDFKRVAASTVKYALMAGIVIAVYYNFVSDELLVKRQQDYILTEQALDTDEELKLVQEQNIQLAHLSREEIIAAAKGRTDLFTNPKVVSSASFIVLIFVSLIYTAFAVLLFRTFLRMR